MLITPAGTSDASSTVYSSVAASGRASDGTATTVLPTATAGATRDTNPSSGCTPGQAIPITPIGSFLAPGAPPDGGCCPPPADLSGPPADRNHRAPAAPASPSAARSPPSGP